MELVELHFLLVLLLLLQDILKDALLAENMTLIAAERVLHLVDV